MSKLEMKLPPSLTPEVQRILGHYKDTVALADIEGVQQILNHYIAEGFVVDFSRDEKGLFGFAYNSTCFADRAERKALGLVDAA